MKKFEVGELVCLDDTDLVGFITKITGSLHNVFWFDMDTTYSSLSYFAEKLRAYEES